MVFPDGIQYDIKKDSYRTIRVNSIFSQIAAISQNSKHKKTGSFQSKLKKSGSVPEAGVEPARPQWSQDFKSCVSTSSTTRATFKLINTVKKQSR